MKKITLVILAQVFMALPMLAQYPYGVTIENTYISLEQAETKPEEVVCLNLRGRGLSEVPEEITHYPNMRVLTLMKNSISTASPLLFQPARLKDLNIRNNTIKEFPLDLLQQWDSLEVLNMAFNQFERLPAELGQVTTLKVLQADHNNISVVASGLSSLEQLQFLILNDNKLESIGPWIKGMKSLRELDLSHNKISAADQMQGTYPDLVTLNLSYNELSSLPINYNGMPALKTLALNSNNFSSLPENLTKLSSLEILIISDNPLIRLPKNIGKMKNLRTLIALNTSFSEKEKSRIRKALPGCDIRF